MTDIVLYGISNCDTIKKARRWLQDRDIDYEFHDYRKQGLESDLLDQLIGGLGWEAMLNRRGTPKLQSILIRIPLPCHLIALQN